MFHCNFQNIRFLKEVRNGFSSVFSVECELCKFQSKIYTCDENNPEMMNINFSAVAGIMGIGSGYSHLNEVFTALDVPCMRAETYKKTQAEVSFSIKNNTLEKMKEAAEEEKKIAIENGDVGKDGKPEITVVCDGTWAKRSYKTNYNSLSGAAAIIGYKTKKILYLGVKNKFCMACAKGSATDTHLCFRNWNGSSTAMEAEILAEGFKCSEDMYGIRYTKFIADGDSSTYKKILETQPYSVTVSKIECRNHLLRNLCTKLRNISTNTKMGPAALRKKVHSKILKIRIGISKAIKYRKAERDNMSINSKNLKKDIMNAASHAFGEHKECAELSYFCKKTTPDEDNLVPDLKSEGIYSKIVDILRHLANHSMSLIFDVDSNVVEQFNSIICKFIGGKRINYCTGGQYQTRCMAAALSFNTKRPHFYNCYKHKIGFSPKSKFYKRMESYRNAVLRSKRKRTKPFIRSTNKADEHYGENCEKPDMEPKEFEEAKLDFVNKNLKRTESELQELEERTREQADCPEWINERRQLLTASNFGEICRKRSTTKNANILKRIMYNSHTLFTAATNYGKINEHKAKEKIEEKCNLKIAECGIFIDHEHQYLGATPDGLVGDRGILEIKCPYSARDLTPEEGINTKKISIWKKNKDGVYEINKIHKWYYQVQGQLHISKRDYCILGVWTPKGLKTEIITKDDEFWEKEMFHKLKSFYFDSMLPEIIDPRFTRSMELR